MRRWTGFLLVRDERLILLNRLAPVVPFVGAFIATLRWNFPRSIAFVAVGGLAKYAFLLYVVFAIGVAYDVGTARAITLVLAVIVVALSFFGSWFFRRRAQESVELRAAVVQRVVVDDVAVATAERSKRLHILLSERFALEKRLDIAAITHERDVTFRLRNVLAFRRLQHGRDES